MPNPLPPNAQLTFKVAGGTTTDAFGNVVPLTTTTVVLAYLKDKALKQGDRRAAGIDPGAIYMEGYAVDPAQLPAGAGKECAIALGQQTGIFQLTALDHPPYGRGSYGSGLAGIGALIEELLGTRLEGWFYPNGSRQ